MQKVSIIMTVYNGQNFLREAIESCLNQTYSNLELIIIDDGSTDNTLSIINSYNDERIKLIENERNKGQSYSRNKGIEESNGEFIAIMDADDIAYPYRINEQVTFLNNNLHIDIVGSWIDIINEQGEFQKVRKLPVENNQIKANLVFECPIVHPTVVFRKKAFQKSNLFYNGDFKYAQDMELWSRAMFNLNFANIPKPLLRMRFGNQYSISFSKKADQINFGQKVISNTMRRLNIDLDEKYFFTNNIFIKMIVYKKIVEGMSELVPVSIIKESLKRSLKPRWQRLLMGLILKIEL